MANIRVDVNYKITDGSEVVFRSPVDCAEITGLIVYYQGEDGNTASKVFALSDAHGNNVGDIDHLFAENVVVKVILDVTAGMAFVQNADTNAYLEGRFAELAKGANAFVGIAGEVTYSQYSEAVSAGKACFMYYENKLYTMSGTGVGIAGRNAYVFYAHNSYTGELEQVKIVAQSNSLIHNVIENAGTVTDEQIASAVENYLKDNPPSGGAQFETDDTLNLVNGVLSVNTTDDMEKDNTLPITSAGVYAAVGNIEALLKTI